MQSSFEGCRNIDQVFKQSPKLHELVGLLVVQFQLSQILRVPLGESWKDVPNMRSLAKDGCKTLGRMHWKAYTTIGYAWLARWILGARQPVTD